MGHTFQGSKSGSSTAAVLAGACVFGASHIVSAQRQQTGLNEQFRLRAQDLMLSRVWKSLCDQGSCFIPPFKGYQGTYLTDYRQYRIAA